MATFLLLALNDEGWGETTTGIRLAQSLQRAGHEPVFLTHHAMLRAFRGSGVPVHGMTALTCRQVDDRVRRLVARQRPVAIVLCDLDRTEQFCRRHAVDARFLIQLGIPLLAIDTWCRAESGTVIDFYMDRSVHLPTRLRGHVQLLRPVPFLRPSSAGAYLDLPDPVPRGGAQRAAVRARLGLAEGARLILLTTAPWQHERRRVPEGDRCQASVPQLLGPMLLDVDPRVHLVHVGPAPWTLGSRYHAMASLDPREFVELLGGIDLFLTLNVSANTLVRAVRSGIPSVLVRSGFTLTSRGDWPGALPSPSPRLEAWLQWALPHYPFDLWPFGWSRFLKPVFEENPYGSTSQTAELLDEGALTRAVSALLFDETARREQRTLQEAYLGSLEGLPSGADAVAALLA